MRHSIAVVGAGYVGLVSAVGPAAKGHGIELVETDPNRLAALRDGRVPFTEAGVQEALNDSLASGDPHRPRSCLEEHRRDHPDLRRNTDR